MNVLLSINRVDASRRIMQRRWITLLTVIAVLFGTVILPTIAHAQAISSGHDVELLDTLQHSATAGHDQQEPDSDKPCHGVAHHHCSAFVSTDGPIVAINSALLRSVAIARASAPMTSFAQAPPTEPPSA